MTSYRGILVFTDLDGTLIDHNTYSWEGAREALEEGKRRGVPIVVCTSKTRAEIEVYREEMGLGDPFISENGGAIFIPRGYPWINVNQIRGERRVKRGKYTIIELGVRYKLLRSKLREIRELGIGDICGFGDMSAEELSQDSGLSLEEARLAKRREYDEAFRFEGDEKRLIEEIERRGLKWTRGGRYWHIMGNNDKGKAVRILTDLFKSGGGKIESVGIGDSLNDEPMLRSVDVPILVQKPDGSYDARVQVTGLILADAPGPVGWNRMIMRILGSSRG